MIWLRRAGLLVLLILLLVIGMFAYLSMTHGGMQRLLSLGQSYAPGEFDWSESSGTLAGPVSVVNLVYVNDAGASVQIDRATFDWQPGKLLSRELYVDELDVNGISIRLPPAGPSQESASGEPFQLPDLVLPVAATIRKLSVGDLKIYPHGEDKPIVIDEILLSGGGRDDEINLNELRVAVPEGEFRMDGNIGTSGSWPIALNNQWQFKHRQYGEYSGHGTVTGEVDSLIVSHEVTGPVTISIDALLGNVLNEPSWDGKITVNADDLGVFAPAVKGVPLRVVANSEGTLNQYSAVGTVESDHPASGPLISDFNLSGNLHTLNVKKVDLKFSNTKATLLGQVELADLNSDMTLSWTELKIPLVEQPVLALSPQGTAHITGTPEAFVLALDTSVSQIETGLLNVVADITGSPRALMIKSITIDGAQAGTRLNASGVVDLEEQRVDLSGDWNGLRWPMMNSAAMVLSPQGDFSVIGPLDNYKLAAAVQFDRASVPAGKWTISADGNTRSLSNILLEGNTLEGELVGTGSVVFSPLPAWNIELHGHGINPSVQWQGLDGKLGFATAVNGSIEDSGPELVATLSELTGHYRQQKLAGKAVVTLQDGTLQVDDLDVSVGQASLKGRGVAGDTLDMKWHLDAPALEKLIPSFTGSVDVDGTLKGTSQLPNIAMEVSMADFSGGGVQVESLAATAHVDLAGNTKSLLHIDGGEGMVSGQRWDKLLIDGSGTPAQHTVDLSLISERANLKVAAKGGVRKQQWRGSIDQLDLSKTAFGDWALQQPAVLRAAQASAQVERFCLSSEPTAVCASAKWSQSKGLVADLEIGDLQAKRFAEFLPSDIAIDTSFNGLADIEVGGTGKFRANAEILMPGGTISYENNGEMSTANLGSSSVKAHVTNDNLTSSVNLDLGELGTALVNATVSGLSSSQRLTGSVDTQLQDLLLLGIVAPQLQSIDGKLFSDLELAGTLSAPVVSGQARIDDFTAEVPSIALKITKGSLLAKSDGTNGLTVSGSAHSGEGKLELSGTLVPRTASLELAIVGDRFQVANTNNLKAEISPDLRVKIAGSDIAVTGDLEVPSAFIKTGGDKNILKESSDVVIADEEGEPSKQGGASQVKLAVNVRLGDDIWVKAGQFNGALSGSLLVEQQPGQLQTGSGTIEVVSGDFLVYGQELTVERGRMLFADGPLDDPTLQLDVARDVTTYNVKAGAKISGTAKSPLLELKSDPPQTDANTLSLILLGKPIGTPGASYTLGKFITPDLYVSYGIDLFDKIQTFNLRYKITERLSLNAAQSKKTSGDLIYTIER